MSADSSTLVFWDFSSPTGNMILDGSGNNFDLQLYNNPSLSLDTFTCQTNSNSLVNLNGCDSVAVLNLTINQSDTSFINVTACDK